MAKDRTAVNILNELLAEIDEYIEKKRRYDSRAEFIRDAIRRLLDDQYRVIREERLREIVREEIQKALRESKNEP